MLNEIADISSKELESGLMDLICHNSECILENGFLDIPQDLFNKVDDAARNFIQRQAPSDKAFFSFQEDFESYNEDLTSMAPIYGVKTHSSISTFRDKNAMALKTLEKNFATPNNCNEGSNEEDIFELEMEERLSKGKEKLTSSSVTGGLSKGNAENAMIKHSSNTGIPSSPTMSLWNNRPGKDHNSPKSSPGQNWSTVSRGSSLYQSPGLDRMSPNNSGESSSSLKTPVRRIVATSSSGSSWQNFKKSPAEYSQKGSSSSSPSSLTSMFAGSKSAKPVTQQQTIHSPNQCGASSKSVSTPQTSSSTPVTYITPEITEFPLGKLSQKERRKLQRERAPSTGESSSSSPAWGLPNLIKPSKPVWNTVNTTSTIGSVPKATTATTITANLDTSTSEFTRNNNSISPGAGKFENNSHTESSNSTTPTLADIIRQEQQIVRIQASQATKSLKDIQQEEAFQKWWSKESQKFQRLQKESSSGGQNNKENIVNGDGHKYNKRRHRPRKNNSNKSQTTVGV